jgi:methylenetetrahydrofolate dehydrogenase (NADP+)/methenyltetrahydrofolate cyclohydrolase
MTARLLDGFASAAAIRAELAPRIASFVARAGRPPGLGIVLVGDDPASAVYVRNKMKSAGDVGVHADLDRLPATASLAEVLVAVERLNASDVHDGILVQSPLPERMGPLAERTVFDAISPAKDVDGFHPLNVGRLVQNRASLVGGTPSGIIALLEREGIPIAGARAVVIGRSDLVGKPLALLLLHRHATVTVCHSRTRDLERVAREADILVAAVGRPAFVTPAFVKPGATVVDVGINRLIDAAAVDRIFGPDSARRRDFDRRGALIVGDVHPDVAAVAGALTPVPGGVGPLTVAMLLANTLRAAMDRLGDASAQTRRC